MLKIYNTLSRKKEILRPRKAKKINFFVCGVTTYDFSHIGHARTYIAFDMIVKYLRQRGYDVFYLQNVTDVDDKIIQRARETGEDAMKLSRRFEKEYMADMKALGVIAVSKYARATSCIKEILSQVGRLLKRGYAYEIAGDGIYFDISKFKDYGKLSRRTTSQAQDAVSRVDESIAKRNKGDFALWKYSKPGEPKWPFDSSPSTGSGSSLRTGRLAGRPGWHIEDTAITEKFFGPQYDIHGGAQDLIFPHHEAEITQMEAVSGKKPFVRYWAHTGFLTVKGEKMSKSLGNFVTIRDFLKDHSPRFLRYFVLKTHYRSPIDYSEELLKQAESELERIDEFVDKAKSQKPKAKTTIQKPKIQEAMDDDFNTPEALAKLFEFIRQANAKQEYSKEAIEFLKEIDQYFEFIFWGREKQTVPEEIKKLADQREAFRKQGNFQDADTLRVSLNKRGWAVEDTPSGYKFKKLVYRK